MGVNGRSRIVDGLDRLVAEANAGAVDYPNQSEVPNWSETTLGFMEPLTNLERAFVEWYVTGCNASEAYRRAKNLEVNDTSTARQNGYAIASRPRVKMAIDAGMKDRNFKAKCDLEWKLAKLRKAIDKCEAMETVQAQQTLADLMKVMAALQGEGNGLGEPDGGDQRGSVRIRILEILADADRLVGGAKTPTSRTADPPDRGSARSAVAAD